MGSPSRAIERPVIIVGAARSGTTLLGHLLAHHPDVAYWEEPVHIWRHRHAYRRDDVFTAADATPAVRKYIRTQFGRFLARSGRSQFVDKTPSNCFRVPFIREVFPDAQFVHLIRDGRAVTVSAMGQWMNDVAVPDRRRARDAVTNTSYASGGGGSFGRRLGDTATAIAKLLRDKRRLTGGLWMILEAPAQVPGLLRVIARKLTDNRSFLWGPRFPGLAGIHRRYSLLETCALQWAFSVQAVLAHTRRLPPDQCLEVRYESLLTEPVETARRVCRFAGLAWGASIEGRAAEVVRAEGCERWRQRLSLAQVELLDAWLSPLLVQLGYKANADFGGETLQHLVGG